MGWPLARRNVVRVAMLNAKTDAAIVKNNPRLWAGETGTKLEI